MTRLGHRASSSLHEQLVHALAAQAAAGDGDAAAAAATEPTPGSDSPGGPNWTLNGCCNETQIVICCLVAAYTLVIFFAWRWFIIRPFKILTVFLHELSHAGAALLTCGKVTGMEVHANEGGVTKTVGGSMWCILPAGYIGSALWGMVFVICSADALAAQIGAGILCVSLLGVLVVADNNTLRALCVGFILLIAGFWALELLTVFQGLRYLLLFVGTMNGWFAVYDIHDDLISRRVHGSDAVKFAELTHTSSRCWGVIWGLISLALMTLGVYLALVVASS